MDTLIRYGTRLFEKDECEFWSPMWQGIAAENTRITLSCGGVTFGNGVCDHEMILIFFINAAAYIDDPYASSQVWDYAKDLPFQNNVTCRFTIEAQGCTILVRTIGIKVPKLEPLKNGIVLCFEHLHDTSCFFNHKSEKSIEVVVSDGNLEKQVILTLCGLNPCPGSTTQLLLMMSHIVKTLRNFNLIL